MTALDGGPGPGSFGGVADALGAGLAAVRLERSAVCEHPGHHSQGAEEEGGDGEDDVDYVLDARGDEEVVAGEAGYGEDVGDVVHHDVVGWMNVDSLSIEVGTSIYRRTYIPICPTDVLACQLKPDLREDTNVGPVDHVRLEELEERSVGVVAFEFAHSFSILKFLNDKRGCSGHLFRARA